MSMSRSRWRRSGVAPGGSGCGSPRTMSGAASGGDGGVGVEESRPASHGPEGEAAQNQPSQSQPEEEEVEEQSQDERGGAQPSRLSVNPYLNFLAELRQRMLNVSQVQIIQEGARRWRAMSAEEKQPYYDMAARARMDGEADETVAREECVADSKDGSHADPKGSTDAAGGRDRSGRDAGEDGEKGRNKEGSGTKRPPPPAERSSGANRRKKPPEARRRPAPRQLVETASEDSSEEDDDSAASSYSFYEPRRDRGRGQEAYKPKGKPKMGGRSPKGGRGKNTNTPLKGARKGTKRRASQHASMQSSHKRRRLGRRY